MTRSRSNKSKSISPDNKKNLPYALSTTEAERRRHYFDVSDPSDNDNNTSKKERQDFKTTKDSTRKRIASEQKKGKKGAKCEDVRFPVRRPSIHFSGEEAFLQSSKNKVPLKKKTNLVIFQKQWCIYIIIPFLLLLVFVGLYYPTNDISTLERSLTIDLIKQTFPKQKDLLWRAISSGLNDTLQFEHPSSYILVYQAEASNTAKKLVKQLSQYAVCYLSNCNNNPIELNTEVLKSSFNDTFDYGVIISQYKKDLENIGVMVIENLDEIPEKFALAFHSFCDQISPLVKRTAFFFTVNIENREESQIYDLRSVEKLLRGKWKHLEDDIFEPLFARLSAMLIRIYPE